MSQFFIKTSLNHKLVMILIVDCRWSIWDEWSECSSLCGAGSRMRKRAIMEKSENGGHDCSGKDIEQEECNVRPCPGTCF